MYCRILGQSNARNIEFGEIQSKIKEWVEKEYILAEKYNKPKRWLLLDAIYRGDREGHIWLVTVQDGILMVLDQYYNKRPMDYKDIESLSSFRVYVNQHVSQPKDRSIH